MKKRKNHKLDFKKIIKWLIVIIASISTGVGASFVIRPTEDGKVMVETTFSIELAEEQVPAEIETEDGITTDDNIVTVASVDSNQLVNDCKPDEECGLGEYIYAPTETPQAFKNYTIGKCWNTDGSYGAQCWDLGDLFWQNYTGRRLSTCGTGAARGIWDCKDYNSGSEFELITDKNALQTGDWIIFNSGRYGHVGMAMGNFNNGYISLLGQNQGGGACTEGGSAANIINISLNSFLGAFRPKTYIKPEPEPEPEPVIPISKCVEWHVVKGDTMSKIMMECEGVIEYGEIMNQYAKSWYSLIMKPGQSVYDGWNSETGVGLYADDDIEHRIK